MKSRVLTTGHIGLNVSDLDRSTEFYRRVFDFQILGQSGESGKRFVFLGHDGNLTLTLWEQSSGRFATDTPGLHHLSFEAASLEEVEEFEQKLRGLGAEFHHDGVVAHAEGASSGGIFFHDPDGIRLEIYSPVGIGAQPAPTGQAPACGFF